MKAGNCFAELEGFSRVFLCNEREREREREREIAMRKEAFPLHKILTPLPRRG